MRPIIEDDIDEEEGLDTLSSLPPSSSPTARPSLHGLDRELSTKFGTSMDSNTNNNDSSRSGQQQQNMSYTDYLQAQKKMQSRRHLVGASAAQKLLRSLRVKTTEEMAVMVVERHHQRPMARSRVCKQI